MIMFWLKQKIETVTDMQNIEVTIILFFLKCELRKNIIYPLFASGWCYFSFK